MEQSAQEPTELAKPNGKAIEIEAVTIKSLEDAERLVAGIQQAARRAFGHRDVAMGTPSMALHELRSYLLEGDANDRAAVSMPGTIEIYHGNELQGFIEVREGGGYVALA